MKRMNLWVLLGIMGASIVPLVAINYEFLHERQKGTIMLPDKRRVKGGLPC